MLQRWRSVLFWTLFFACLAEKNAAEAEAKVFLAASDKTKKTQIYWEKVARAAKYKFELFAEGGKPLLAQQVENNSIAINLEPGKYQFRVAGVSKLGKQGQFTENQQLVVTPKGTNEELEQRVEIIQELKTKIEESNETGSPNVDLTNVLHKRENQFGVSFDYTLQSSQLNPYGNFFGGSAFLRYGQLFVKNLKPDYRLGYVYSRGLSGNFTGLGIFKSTIGVSYTLNFLRDKMSLVPTGGGGLMIASLSVDNFGNTYFCPGAVAGLDLFYNFSSLVTAFVRAESAYIMMPNNPLLLISPTIGFAYRF